MKQYVLVAGVDYEFKGIDFRGLADNRRRRFILANRAREQLRFTLFDFRAGAVVTTDVTYSGSVKTEATSSSTPFKPIGPANYTRDHRFKPNQIGTASILDVYKAVQDIGAADPGTLVELSFFAHGFMGGPILVNSFEQRNVAFQLPAIGPIPATSFTISLVGTTLRDPHDMDPRTERDFAGPTMDSARLALFRAAFASPAVIWLWGCNFPGAIHRILTAIERSPQYRSTGLKDDDELKLKILADDDVKALEDVLIPILGPFPSRTSVTVKLKHLKHVLCLYNASTYAQAIADAANVDTVAAALGTYSDYDTRGANPLMNVVPIFGQHIAFYRNYLGFSFDPEGRRYAIYPPGRTCPRPP